MTSIDINCDALVKHTARLERMSRSALPVAVRSTLSRAAFDVKTNTMPKGAKRQFIERKPNFFKANSKVQVAQGFDIASMQATVGFVGKNSPDRAVEDLEQQEHGGEIGGRSYVPLQAARTGNKWKGNVRAAVRISKIAGKVVDVNNVTGENAKEKFTKSAIHAGKGGFILGDRKTGKGNRILFQVRSIKRIKGNIVVKSVPMFALKSGRVVKPDASHFMKEASVVSAGKMKIFFLTEAKKQIDKIR